MNTTNSLENAKAFKLFLQQRIEHNRQRLDELKPTPIDQLPPDVVLSREREAEVIRCVLDEQITAMQIVESFWIGVEKV